MKNIITLLLITFSTSLLSCTKSPTMTSTIDTYFEMVRPEFKGDVAFETTAFVEKFWRVAGNTGFNESVYRVVAKLEEAGYVLEANAIASDRLTYRIETRKMDRPTWEPVDASLSIVGANEKLLEQSTNRNMVLLNSASTPEGGITADVVYVQNLDDLKSKKIKGKIVYGEMRPSQLYKDAIEAGAIGIITYDNPAYLQPEKNKTSIQFRRLPYLEKYKAWGIALSYEANEKLKKALTSGAVKVKVDITTKIYSSEELTVVANVRGSSLPKESLVFSAHIQEPGANDNATGVGAQLEMAMITAKLLKSGQLEAKRTLTFLWGDEIISTHRYITEKEKRTSEINWGISLDMVGENTSLTGGSFLIEKMPDPSAIWTRGDDKHSEWGGEKLALDDMKPHYLNDFIIYVFEKQGAHANWVVNTNPFEGGSDHTPFLKADIPGLLLWHFTDQFYHTDNDRIDKVSKESLKNVGTAALVSAYTLINADEKTAQELLDLLRISAEIRLNKEFELSKAAVEGGKPVEEEEEILNAWSDWYQKSFSTVVDVVSSSDQSLLNEISKAQEELKKLNDTYSEELEATPSLHKR
ncbi:MAG TPA: M28 family peptidase [Cyclobacteriaceae bacterium]|nr:M28 family peptidase [Cyclobacteriaceae bacterium]